MEAGSSKLAAMAMAARVANCYDLAVRSPLRPRPSVVRETVTPRISLEGYIGSGGRRFIEEICLAQLFMPSKSVVSCDTLLLTYLS